VDGEESKVRIYHSDAEFYTRIEAERIETWELGIDEEGIAQLVSTSAVSDDLTADPDLPKWLVETLYGIGISEIKT
jgi:hypothetical protein